MNFSIELEQEEDGRWIAEVCDLPGVLIYEKTRKEALAKVQALALRVLADCLEHHEGIGPRMVKRISKSTGLRPEDLSTPSSDFIERS